MILLDKDDKSWAPVLLHSLRQTPAWQDVTKQIEASCERLKNGDPDIAEALIEVKSSKICVIL